MIGSGDWWLGSLYFYRCITVCCELLLVFFVCKMAEFPGFLGIVKSVSIRVLVVISWFTHVSILNVDFFIGGLEISASDTMLGASGCEVGSE